MTKKKASYFSLRIYNNDCILKITFLHKDPKIMTYTNLAQLIIKNNDKNSLSIMTTAISDPDNL